MNDERSVRRSLTILVGEEQAELIPPRPPVPGKAQEQGLGQWARKWMVRDKDLDLEDIQEKLEQVQSEVDGILEGLKTTAGNRFDLNEVQVQLGVSASGSVGVVSAGVQASLTLVYSRQGQERRSTNRGGTP